MSPSLQALAGRSPLRGRPRPVGGAPSSPESRCESAFAVPEADSSPCASDPAPSLIRHAAMFSPGDLVWVPSASEGYSTAVFVSLNIAQDTLTAQLHPAAAQHAAAARELLGIPAASALASSSPASDASESRASASPRLQPLRGERLGAPPSTRELAAAVIAGLRSRQGSPSPLSPRAGNSGEEAGSASLACEASPDQDSEGGEAPYSVEVSPDSASASPPPSPHAAPESGFDSRLSTLPPAGMGPVVTVPLSDCWPYHPSPLPPSQPPEDASALDSLSSPSILELLEHRFLRRQIYTNAAHVLLALNPYTALPDLYSQEVIDVYRHWKSNSASAAAASLPASTAALLGLVKEPPREAGSSNAARPFHGSPFPPPHPFAVAEDAHRRLRGEGKNQTIIVSGESGAGKTETSKIIMLYLTQVGVHAQSKGPGADAEATSSWLLSSAAFSQSRQERERAVAAMLGEGGKSQTQGQVSTLQQKILSCNPVLEAFCNATTRRNVNSSRVGRLTFLHFDSVGLLRGASIKTYLLESARVSAHALWERNYHVFYQVLRGCSDEDLVKRRLTRDYRGYGLLRPTESHVADDRGLRRRSLRASSCKATRSGHGETPLAAQGRRARDADALRPSPEEVERDAANFVALMHALRTTGFSKRQISEILDIVAGLLHLSNVNYVEGPPVKAGDTHSLLLAPDEGTPAPTVAEGESGGDQEASSRAEETSRARCALTAAAELLKIEADAIEEVLRWEVLRTRHDVVRKERREKQAVAARDALVKFIYKKLVAYILQELNRNVRKCTGEEGKGASAAATEDAAESDEETEDEDACEDPEAFIGILDIYGFECVDGSNGFDQLCINYANERQQELFIQKVLYEELRLYAREGIVCYSDLPLGGDAAAGAGPPSPAGLLAPLPVAPVTPRGVSAASASCSQRGLSPRSPARLAHPSGSGASGASPCPWSPHESSAAGNARLASCFAVPSPAAELGAPFSLPGGSLARDGTEAQVQRFAASLLPDRSLLLAFLHEGLFRRLDDNSRLKAQGQQRTDAHFWRDFFLFCRQQQQLLLAHRPAALGAGDCEGGGLRASSAPRGAAAERGLGGAWCTAAPILFRLKGGAGAAAAFAAATAGERGRDHSGAGAAAWRRNKREFEEAEEGLVGAGKVLPNLSDGAAAANKVEEGIFVVRHFAGLVQYDVEGWLDRNNDKAEASIESLISFSPMKTLRRLALVDGGSKASSLPLAGADASPSPGFLSPTHGSRSAASSVFTCAGSPSFQPRDGLLLPQALAGGSKGHFSSLSRTFINDLRQLMTQLGSSSMHLHFIRCFVPNGEMLPLTFNRLLLLRQLQQSGSVALVQILHQGFPHRLPLRATAAAFKEQLALCVENVKRQTTDADTRRRLEALLVQTIPDGRLIACALSQLPSCPAGSHCCGTSLVCFKVQSYPAASSLLRQPTAFFDSAPPLLRLLSDVTRRRWRVGIVVAGRVKKVLAWLLRRAQLLRRLKEEAAQLAVRVILLKRVILNTLRQKVQKRARVRQGVGGLQRMALRVGFDRWRSACRRWAQAEAAVASLAARKELANQLNARHKSDLAHAVLARQRGSLRADAEDPDEAARETEKAQAEEEERRRGQEAALTTRLAGETWKYAWKAELFNMSAGRKTRCGRRGGRDGDSRAAAADCERMLLFSGVGLFAVDVSVLGGEQEVEVLSARCSRLAVGPAGAAQPVLACLGQHSRYPELFVVADSRARIFLLPLASPSLRRPRESLPPGGLDAAALDNRVGGGPRRPLSPSSPVYGVFDSDRRDGARDSLGFLGPRNSALMLLMGPTASPHSPPASRSLARMPPSPAFGLARGASPRSLEDAEPRPLPGFAAPRNPLLASSSAVTRVAGREEARRAPRECLERGEGRGIGLPAPLSAGSPPSLCRRASPADSETWSVSSSYRSSSSGAYSTSSSAPDAARCQPSTSLPSLVPSSSYCCAGQGGGGRGPRGGTGVASPGEGLAVGSPVCRMRQLNPYLARFRQPAPPPPSIFADADGCGRDEKASGGAPRLFFSCASPSSPLLLPGGVCQPNAVMPGRWVPVGLLRLAEREQEKLEKQLQRGKAKVSRSKEANTEVSVRTLRIRFASPSSTLYVLVLCHVSVVGDKSESHVGGVLALVLVNLLSSLPEAWVEIIPCEPDVVALAREHRDALPDLLYRPPAAAEGEGGSKTLQDEAAGAQRPEADASRGDAGKTRQSRGSPATSVSCPRSRVISTTILEPIEGGNKWVVAGPGVLALARVRLPHELICEAAQRDAGEDADDERRRRRVAQERGPGSREGREAFVEREGLKAQMDVVWNAREIQAVANVAPPVSIAGTWFTGCMYSASPLSSLQDIGPSHPLFYFASAISSTGSRFLSSLQEDIQHLVLLSTAKGELLLLRWLEQRQALQLLERKATQNARRASTLERFLRLSYSLGDEVNAAEELADECDLPEEERERRWKQLGAEGTVLRVTAPHPQLAKQQKSAEDARKAEPLERSGGASSVAARGAKKVPVSTRWCEDVAAVRLRAAAILKSAPLVHLPGAKQEKSNYERSSPERRDASADRKTRSNRWCDGDGREKPTPYGQMPAGKERGRARLDPCDRMSSTEDEGDATSREEGDESSLAGSEDEVDDDAGVATEEYVFESQRSLLLVS
ncbi:myosin J [Besnoitia besnoiti]|uniref:Myosin J n=1 Tax=Besnoitia besnoiti TaxID=94643 RepID=A0A2A9MB06_BESBE|nr:myosin J [Besnoitia besnoiti]PFH33491.1 myosin J [Besnoitia besnoiti]